MLRKGSQFLSKQLSLRNVLVPEYSALFVRKSNNFHLQNNQFAYYAKGIDQQAFEDLKRSGGRQQQQRAQSERPNNKNQQQSKSSSGEQNPKSFTNPYVSSLRQFFLKVHPDFFQNKPELAKVNQKSFATLNELLSWVGRFTDPSVARDPPPFMQHTFIFHCKSDEAGTPPQKISVAFSLMKTGAIFDIQNRKSITFAARRVDECILALLDQAGIFLSLIHI